MITAQEMIERKTRIVYSAYQLFSQKGIASVTMAEIAKKAKVGEVSVYRYFGTKANLLLDTQKILWSDIVDKISQSTICQAGYYSMTGFLQMDALLTGFQNLHLNYCSYLRFALDYKHFLSWERLHISSFDYYQMMQPVTQMFIDALQKGKADGSITRTEDVDTLFFSIWGIMRGYVEQISFYDDIYVTDNPYKARFSTVCSIILDSLHR